MGIITGPLTSDDEVRPMPPGYDGKPIKWGLDKNTPLPEKASDVEHRLHTIPGDLRRDAAVIRAAMELEEDRATPSGPVHP